MNRPMGPPPDGHGPGFGPGRSTNGKRPPNEMRGAFPPAFDAMAKMTPDQREKALAAAPHFSKMPPERQAEVRQRLERFSAMTPEQQQLMRDRFTIMNGMSPAGRERMREVFPQWRSLPEDRRKAMLDEFRTMSDKPLAEREKRFADPDFQKQYSPKEKQLLKDLAELLR